MRVGTITTKEFQEGESTIRRQKSAEHLKKKAEEAKTRFANRISELALLRLKLLIPWWHMKFPTRQLLVIFGNGEHLPMIDRRHVFICPGLKTEIEEARDAPRGARRASVPRGTLFKELEDALVDVDDITNSLRDGCPDDLLIEPIKATKRKRAIWQTPAQVQSP